MKKFWIFLGYITIIHTTLAIGFLGLYIGVWILSLLSYVLGTTWGPIIGIIEFVVVSVAIAGAFKED